MIPIGLRIALWLALLSPRQDQEAVLSANEPVVQSHLKSIRPIEAQPEQPVFDCGSSNTQFQLLCRLTGVKPKQDVENDKEKPWVLKDRRKTCVTYSMLTCQNLRSNSLGTRLAV
jgi:hypothetical protein